MRSGRARKPITGVSLFPFLAVLICTMGALIVLLLIMVQQGHVEARAVAQDKAEVAPAVSPEELKQQAEQKAREAGEVAAKQLSRAAWSTLAMLLLGAVLSFFVGRFALTSRRVPLA